MSIINGPETITSSSTTATLSVQAEQEPFILAPICLFYIQIGGTTVALFTECSGIGIKREVVDTFWEGGVNDYKHILPGRVEYDHVTLKRGVSKSTTLWDWFQAGKDNFAVSRQSVTIVQVAPGVSSSSGNADASGTASTGFGTIKKWTLANAFPVSWKLSELNVNSTDGLAVETLEIAHEGITLETS
jgi:phage tail-like protein